MADDPDQVVLDRKTVKALGVSTRLDILKLLLEKEKTLSDLASELGLAAPTVKEHLRDLAEAGLVRREETDRKWKYYRITFKGKRVVSPYETKVVFALFASLVLAVVSAYQLFSDRLLAVGSSAYAAAPLAEKTAAPRMAALALDMANTTTTTLLHRAGGGASGAALATWGWIFLLAISVLAIGLIAGHFVTRIVVIRKFTKK